MLRFSLTVHPTVGTDVSEVFIDALALARRLDLMVCFDFNGCHCYVSPGDKALDLLNRWWAAREKNMTILPIRDTRGDHNA